MRYFNVMHNPVGRFLRHHPSGLSIESLGDPSLAVDERLRAIAQTVGYTHDDVERHIVEAIGVRATQTLTVGASCLAVQLDPRECGGQAQFTYYPAKDAEGDAAVPTFITGWVLTERMICSPGTQSTFGSTVSACGKYVIGGFSDGITNLHVRARLPSEVVHHGGPHVMAFGSQTRARPT